MPELPEAETIVRGLRSTVSGERIARVRIVHADVLRQPQARFIRQVVGRRIQGIERRGKNVLLRLDDRSVIAINLGMTGRPIPFPCRPPKAAAPTHPAVVFTFESGGVLVYNDVRRFGTIEHLDEAGWDARSAAMGPEPLDPGLEAVAFHEALSRSRAPVRSWLLDQKRVAGVGNIYAAEALFLAGVHPKRRAGKLTREEAYALLEQLRCVLEDAIDAGGTTIRDYRNVYGGQGEYVRQLAVYGREGEPCRTCGAAIERVVFGNRSAFFCPRCQPARPR